jgi:hypothetical protein
MENNGFKRVLKVYLKRMYKLYHQENLPGINDYCLVLKDLLYSSFDFFQEKISKEDIKIEILETPKDLQIHMPRIRVWNEKSKVYGYIDVLEPVMIREDISSYEMVHNYKRLFSNFMLTNFFVFFYYKNTELIGIPRPFAADFIGELKTDFHVTSSRVIEILENFINYRHKGYQSKNLAFIGLQKGLALKTFYLKKFVLPKLTQYSISQGENNFMSQVYGIYRSCVKDELSVKDFSCILAQIIINALLRDRLAPFIHRIIDCASIFKFILAELDLKMGYPYDLRDNLFDNVIQFKIPMTLKWILDDIFRFVSLFETNEIEQFFKKPVKIDRGKILWDGFLLPYYESPEDFQRIGKLLKEFRIYSTAG